MVKKAWGNQKNAFGCECDDDGSMLNKNDREQRNSEGLKKTVRGSCRKRKRRKHHGYRVRFLSRKSKEA